MAHSTNSCSFMTYYHLRLEIVLKNVCFFIIIIYDMYSLVYIIFFKLHLNYFGHLIYENQLKYIVCLLFATFIHTITILVMVFRNSKDRRI